MSRLYILLALLLLCTPAFAEDRALIIGINRYPYLSPREQLSGPVNDARAMAALARDIWGFRPGQIKLLIDEQATSSNIIAAIRNWLIEGTSPGDRVLLSYAGHGYHQPDDNNDELDGLDETLVPFDVRHDGVRLVNMISDDQIGRLLAGLGGRDVMLVIDSCHSGTISRALEPASGKGPSIVRSPEIGQISRSLDEGTFDRLRRGSSSQVNSHATSPVSISPSKKAASRHRAAGAETQCSAGSRMPVLTATKPVAPAASRAAGGRAGMGRRTCSASRPRVTRKAIPTSTPARNSSRARAAWKASAFHRRAVRMTGWSTSIAKPVTERGGMDMARAFRHGKCHSAPSVALADRMTTGRLNGADSPEPEIVGRSSSRTNRPLPSRGLARLKSSQR